MKKKKYIYKGTYYRKVIHMASKHVWKSRARPALLQEHFQQPWRLDETWLPCTVQLDIWTTFTKRYLQNQYEQRDTVFWLRCLTMSNTKIY